MTAETSDGLARIERARRVEPVRTALAILSSLAAALFVGAMYVCSQALWDWRVCLGAFALPPLVLAPIVWNLVPKLLS